MPLSIRKLVLAAVLAGVSAVQADQLFIPGMQAQQVTFTDFTGEKLVYRTQRGEANDRELDRINYIAVDGEPAFNDAEVALIKEDKDKAIDGYTRAIRATAKPWLKHFAARRLLIALGDADRFDARVVAYLALLEHNPDEAMKFKPDLPPKGNRQLDTAITDIENVLKQSGIGAAQQVGLYTFLVDLHRRKGDEPAAIATLERLAKVADSMGDMPEIRAQLAGARVAQARLALDQKKYADAIKLIQDNRASISDPRLQSDALFTLAAANRATVNKSDKKAMQDVALQFMRVAAHFGEVEGRPNVLPSLIATAEILEQIDQKDGAAKLYEQIAAEFPDTPAAKQAAENLKRLQPAS
jgi:tetratricopeptide (TPR) repeat protein